MRLLLGALVLGLAADGLLSPMVPGINVALGVLALAAVTVALSRWGQVRVTGEGRWLILPALFFAAAFAWRDSLTLQLLNGLALMVALCLMALRARSGGLRAAGLTDYLLGVPVAGLRSVTGHLPLIFKEIGWQELPRGRWSGALFGVGRGLVIAVPLLFLFGGLFASADAVFGQMMQRLLHWDVNWLASHTFTVILYSLVAAGFLRLTLASAEWRSPERERFAPFSLGILEVGIALGLLDLLFLLFVHVQFRYFFGGAALVRISPGLTYAQYARHGFFELVSVAAWVLPVLLLLHWLLRKENAAHERLFRALAAMLVVMVFVVMGSAVQRMRLYQDAYGMTELRFYTTAFMGWLAALIFWFAATVLRGRRERFAFGALVSAFLAIGLLDQINPDAFIARTNVARLAAGRSFDPNYVTSLSADAVPDLVGALPVMDEARRHTIEKRLLASGWVQGNEDWRTWNWSRKKASRAVTLFRAGLSSDLRAAR